MSSPDEGYQIPDELKVAGDTRWVNKSEWCQAVQVYRSGALTVTTGTPTVVGWDGEDLDTNTLHDTVTNNDRLTALIPGIYWVYVGPRWGVSGVGERIVRIKKNGSTLKTFEQAPETTGGRTAYTEGMLVRLAYSEYVTMEVEHTVGVNLNLEGGSTESFFGMYRVA